MYLLPKTVLSPHTDSSQSFKPGLTPRTSFHQNRLRPIFHRKHLSHLYAYNDKYDDAAIDWPTLI